MITIENILKSKRKAKLEELERKYREKREMESMREAGLLDANPNIQSLYVSQHPPIHQSGIGNKNTHISR